MSLITLLGLAALSSAQSVSITPAASAAKASSVSHAIDPAFAGMGIEPSNLFSFTGGNNANQLSINLLQNLADYSGVPPHLRIGGNTGDYFIYDDSFTDMYVKHNPDATGQGAVASDSMIIGPGFWTALNRFPTGTPITFGLNLAYEASDYLDQIVKEAKACIEGLTNVALKSFEIGNEPDLYLQNGFRTGSWGGQTWTQEFTARAAAVYQQVLAPKGMSPAFFEGPNTASTIGTTFGISQLDTDGVTASVNSSAYGYMAAWNEHDYLYFVSVSSFGLTIDWMMNMDNTDSQFAYWTQEVRDALQTGLPYHLREMSSCGPIGLQGISDTFANALWTLNFFAYAATLNISSVQMHMTDNHWGAPWQPINMYNQGPHVRPSYYAFAAFAQLVGNGNGTTQMSPISIPATSYPSGYTGRLRMYSAYASGNLASVVLINTQPYNASSSSTRGSVTFTLSLPSNKGQTLYLSYLTADGSDVTNGTTWNGISYEENSNGQASRVSSQTQTVDIDSSGKATVTVKDSEAVIANLGSLLGSNAVIAPSGTTSAPTTRASHKSAAPTSNGGASTAVIGGVVTTAISAATSVGGAATSTAKPKSGANTMKRSMGMFYFAGVVGISALASGWMWY